MRMIACGAAAMVLASAVAGGAWMDAWADAGLEGDVIIGAISPVTGGAFRYGEEIELGAKLAAIHFNRHLDELGARWDLRVQAADSQTDPAVALHHLESFRGSGIGVVAGPSIDLINGDMLEYANQNDMALLSCCSALPSLAIQNDSLFRTVTTHDTFGDALAHLMRNSGMRAVVPVGIDAGWVNELHHSAAAAFEGYGGDAASPMAYGSPESYQAVAAELAAKIEEYADTYGLNQTAVLCSGFSENAEFVRAASRHDVLGKVRWFGADLNTIAVNIVDDAHLAEFAGKTRMLSVQPATPEGFINGVIDYFVEFYLDREPSPYADYSYNAVWLIGLAMLEADSSEPEDVRRYLPVVARTHSGAVGPSELTPAGDLARSDYAVWEVREGGWDAVMTYRPGAGGDPWQVQQLP